MMSLTPFILAAAAVLMTPGPTNTILAASGAAMGLRNAALLPLAEAAGYAVAVSLYLVLTRSIAEVHAALPILKCVAAAWLLISAWKLWKQRVEVTTPALGSAFGRVLLTTLLNPKAMLVGTILIPNMLPERKLVALGCFLTLSLVAGMGWVALGSFLPSSGRPHAYKGAAVILGAFAFVAASSALSG